MSTTSGIMKNLKVTDKDGNIFNMAPVDSEARQAIDEAKNLQFDEDYFTSELSQYETELYIGLNGVPIGVESPLKFVQDDAQGIVIGSDALTQSSADTLYYPLSNNPSGYLTNTDISATAWNSVYDTVNSNSGSWTSSPAAQLTAGTDLIIDSNTNIISINTDGTAESANMSFVAGSGTYASGVGAAAFGYNTTAGGDYAFAAGCGSKANGSAMTVVGKYNRTTSSTAALFVIGNGTSDSDRSDILLVTTGGSRTILRGTGEDATKYYRSNFEPKKINVYSSDSANNNTITYESHMEPLQTYVIYTDQSSNISRFSQMTSDAVTVSSLTTDSCVMGLDNLHIINNSTNQELYINELGISYKKNNVDHSITWKDLIDKVNALT